jgi:hypothetical protein
MVTHTRFAPIIALLLLALLAGCSAHRAGQLRRQWLEKSPQTYAFSDKPTDSLTLSYIGCGGFLLQYGGDKLLIDPFFSNKSMPHLLTSPLRPDHLLMHRFFERELGTTEDRDGQIGAILVSHAHYDHLGDVPFLLRDYLHNPFVTVYGSSSAVHLVRSFGLPIPDTARQLQSLEPFFKVHSTRAEVASDLPVSPFFYLPNGRIRFAAVPSQHVGHFTLGGPRKLPFIGGKVNKTPEKPAYFGLKYKEGQNYNFIIDLLDTQGRCVFRLFSNAGAACNAGVGYPPKEMLADKGVDLLLVCGANYDVADSFPLPLIDHVQPNAVWVAHWENFFTSQKKVRRKTSIVPGTNVVQLMKNLEEKQHKMGYPKKILIEYPQERQNLLRF